MRGKVVAQSATVKKRVWLPQGDWFSWNAEEGRACSPASGKYNEIAADTVIRGPIELDLECRVDQMPVYVNVSRIIPTRSSDLNKAGDNSIIWVLFASLDSRVSDAEGHLFEDDGISMDYHNSKSKANGTNSAGMLTTVSASRFRPHQCASPGTAERILTPECRPSECTDLSSEVWIQSGRVKPFAAQLKVRVMES